MMPIILITGMSGVGKTAVTNALRSRGFTCMEMDDEGWSYIDDDGHQRWHVDRLIGTIRTNGIEPLFIVGCSEDQSSIYGECDEIILLSVPQDILIQRIQTRKVNSYGKDPNELAYIIDNLNNVEPMLRRRCTHEIVTLCPVEDVVNQILDIMNSSTP